MEACRSEHISPHPVRSSLRPRGPFIGWRAFTVSFRGFLSEVSSQRRAQKQCSPQDCTAPLSGCPSDQARGMWRTAKLTMHL